MPLVLEKPEGVTINLWRDRQAQSRTVFLQTAKKALPPGSTRYATLPPGLLLNVSQRALDRQELDGTIGPDRYVAIANVAPRKEIRLTVCVDPTAPDVDPGTYVGSVRVFSPLIQPLTVPVTVTLQQPGYRWIVPVFGILILLAGSFTVWASGKKAQQAVKPPEDGHPHASVWLEIGELPSWMMNNYVGVVAGAIAATSVFIARYWRNPAWGARAPEDWLALFGSMFTAFTASLAAATALVPQRPKARNQVPETHPPPESAGPDSADQTLRP